MINILPRIGLRVKLPAIPEEGMVEEHGEITGITVGSPMVIVTTDKPLTDVDDCIREVHVLQLQKAD